MIKNFNIEVISKKPETINNIKAYRGQITIGDLKETFYMALDMWTVDEYKQQWREAIERIKTHSFSCFVVKFAGPIENPWIALWVLYKENNTVFVQNHCLFYEIFQERSKGLPPFDANTCYLYVTPRETITESGNKISEWNVDFRDILEFRVI